MRSTTFLQSCCHMHTVQISERSELLDFPRLVCMVIVWVGTRS